MKTLFIGIDPGTDLRGVGLLGLFHLLHLVVNPATAGLAREITLLSKTEQQVCYPISIYVSLSISIIMFLN